MEERAAPENDNMAWVHQNWTLDTLGHQGSQRLGLKKEITKIVADKIIYVATICLIFLVHIISLYHLLLSLNCLIIESSRQQYLFVMRAETSQMRQ